MQEWEAQLTENFDTMVTCGFTQMEGDDALKVAEDRQME